jgi:hypothetical protein
MTATVAHPSSGSIPVSAPGSGLPAAHPNQEDMIMPMEPINPDVPARSNMPLLVVIILAALVALGLAFSMPWW